MTDGTGTTKYTYDQLDRLTESENGHKEVSKYGYDLANEQTKITYPNTKSVTRAFDSAGRLEKITDWSSNVTKFTYNEDSQQATTLFPTATTDEDKYAYNDADQMTEAKMLKGTETLASLVYTRDNDGQLKKTTSKGLPGAEITENTYDENNRLTKSGSEYKYDPANNATTIGTGTYKYNKGDELETGPSLTYTYDELGERTKTKPTSGPATTYGYDQAGDLTSVERPKEGEVSEIKDSYAYNGEGLRASQTIAGTTTYLAWDVTEGLPLILSDGTNSYIYGPGGVPIEQVSSGGTVTYMHHDQQGSTRLLTGSTGTVTGKCSYGAYGTATCEGATTTPLGYDGQYTSSDTGLIYMRARVYDPTTAQFLTVDPLAGLTLAPYSYGNDSPLNFRDPTGLIFGIAGTPSAGEIVGAVESAGSSTINVVNQGAKDVAGIAHYAAPVLDAAVWGACIAQPELCGGALLANFFAQQVLVALQAHYVPSYSAGPDEGAILAGTALGGLGASAADLSGLEGLGKAFLSGGVTYPQLLLDAAGHASLSRGARLWMTQERHYRTRRSRFTLYPFSIVAALLGLLLALASWGGILIHIGGIIALIAMLWIMRNAARMGIRVGEDEIVVYGSFRTHYVAWRDVAGFTTHRVSSSHIVDLKLTDGHTIKTSLVQGVPVTWRGGRTEDVLSVLEAEVGSRAVTSVTRPGLT
jgi:RHS repeat-associated protein